MNPNKNRTTIFTPKIFHKRKDAMPPLPAPYSSASQTLPTNYYSTIKDNKNLIQFLRFCTLGSLIKFKLANKYS